MNVESNNDLILEGAVGVYRRIDLNSASADISSLVPFDSDLGSLGFVLIGDLMCSALSGLLRCYIQPKDNTRALLLVAIKNGVVKLFGLMFEVKFSDGASLTTTTWAMREMSQKGFYLRVHPWEGVYDLYQKHQNHLNELKTKHGDVQPTGDTLLSVAQSIDSDSVRMSQ